MSGFHRRWRLAVLLSHPIQYRVPLMRRLAAHPQIERFKAYFYTNTGLVSRPDSYHGRAVRWDVPLLDGYDNEILADWRLSKGRSGGYINPAVLSRLMAESWDAVMITSYLYPSDWMAWLMCKLQGKGILFHGEMYPRAEGNTFFNRVKTIPKKVMLGRGTACLAIGSCAIDAFKKLGIPSERIFLTPYAVDNDFFKSQADFWRMKRTEIKSAFGIEESTPVVLCVAGMVPKKRQTDLVEAMAHLATNARLILVGDGPQFNGLKAFCKKRLPDAILPGFKNQTELPCYYAIADVFVLPSLWEEFGLVVNEAMCSELPIVASDGVAAARDLVFNGENGFTFPAGDIDALADCLKTLINDVDLRRKFGKRSGEIIAGWNYDRDMEGILSALEYLHYSRF